MRLRQAAPPSASSIHTLRARKPNHVIGNVAAYIDVVLPSLGGALNSIPSRLPSERKSSIRDTRFFDLCQSTSLLRPHELRS